MHNSDTLDGLLMIILHFSRELPSADSPAVAACRAGNSAPAGSHQAGRAGISPKVGQAERVEVAVRCGRLAVSQLRGRERRMSIAAPFLSMLFTSGQLAGLTTTQANTNTRWRGGILQNCPPEEARGAPALSVHTRNRRNSLTNG